MLARLGSKRHTLGKSRLVFMGCRSQGLDCGSPAAAGVSAGQTQSAP
jgi:hypothetical protein